MIERNRERFLPQRQETSEHADALPDDSILIRPIADANRADDWAWVWTEEGEPRAGEGKTGGGERRRGRALIEHMRGRGTVSMTTEEIMALMRGEP